MSTHALFGGKVRYAIVTLALVAVLGGVLVPTTAQALSLAELIDLFIALEIIPADKAAQARSIVAQEKTSPSAACPFTWTRNLTVGASGPDVQKLQEFLNGAEATKISGTGAGSTGKESTYFGSMTAAAVVKFQDVYASSVLTPVGLKKGTGYFGSSTRAKANELCATATVGGAGNQNPVGGDISDVPAIPTGTGLTVRKSAVQPANALLPQGAARVPFTTIELSAGSETVTVTGITVMRQGLASNNSFTGVVLLDENGTILGNAKTLNTDNQAVVGGTFVVPKGTTKKVTVAANMNADLTLQTGEVPAFAVVGVNSGSTVTATYPIVGAQHTINSSLLIGGVTVSRGSLDPNTSLDKTVGTKDYVFSSVKLTATANEDVLLKSIRWYQSESASAEDVENVKMIVDGVEYAATRDGRYYQTVFPSTGILIKKGLSKDVSVKADIVSGSGRAIDFDIERDTDINLVGTTYGYGVTPPHELTFDTDNDDDSAFRTSNNPYYDASQVSVSAGTMNVSVWTQVSAANVGTSVAGEKLMGFTVEVRGEPVTVGSLTVSVDNTVATANLADLTNVVLTDANGAILAGPRDGSGTSEDGDITFTETITFPVGVTNVYVKGKLGTDFETNDTVVVSTDPSTQWTSVRGENTSATLTLTSGTITGQTMTVRGGALTVSVSGLPASQTVIAGAQNFEFARYIFDASRSSENVRLSTLPLHFANVGATRTDLTSCKLYDGATALTTGGNVKNPAVGETPEATTFTFDNGGFVIPEGSIKTLSLKCNIKSGATGTYQWGLDGAQETSYTGATGVETGLTITEDLVGATGPLMTASNSGGYTVSSDTSLIYRLVQAGSSDVELARFRFEAGVGEDVSVKQIALELVNAGDNSPTDLQNEKVSIWVGATKVGEAQFGATADEAVATLATPITIPRGDSVTVSVKGDLATHNAISGTPGAHLTVGYNGNVNSLDGNYGKGLASGITIYGGSSDVSSNGVRIFRTLPQIEDVTPANVTLTAGSDLYQVKVTASNGRDVGIRSFAFNTSSVGTTVDDFVLYGPNGLVNDGGTPVSPDIDGVVRIVFADSAIDRVVPANGSKVYRLRANDVGVLTSGNVETLTVALRADTAYPSANIGTTLMGTVAEVETNAGTEDNFIWTPFSATTPQTGAGINSNDDWTNGYGVPGYPGVGQNMQVRVFSH